MNRTNQAIQPDAGRATPGGAAVRLSAAPFVNELGYYQSSQELEHGLEVQTSRLSELPPELINALLAMRRAAR